MNISLHTGCAGEQHTISVDWFDENNISKTTVVEINIQPQDKPRTLEVVVDGRVLYETFMPTFRPVHPLHDKGCVIQVVDDKGKWAVREFVAMDDVGYYVCWELDGNVKRYREARFREGWK
jgi:hypothetical protein